MRGALSLAAALSIPATIAHRDEILFLTFTTILGGLVVLGIPLPWLLEQLGFRAGDGARVEAETLRALTEAALRKLAELEEEGTVSDEYIDSLRQLYEARLGRLDQQHHDGGDASLEGYRQLRRELLAAERVELRRRERDGRIGSAVARAIERRLDHEESGLRQ